MTAENKTNVKRMKELKLLLAEFEAQLTGFNSGVLTGFNPGVSASIKRRHLHFGSTEWAWLEPLLKELRSYRRDVAERM